MKNCVHVHPDICNGKPVIKGTRITVQTVMEFLEAGDTVEDVLEEYPTLSREDVYACYVLASQSDFNNAKIR